MKWIVICFCIALTACAEADSPRPLFPDDMSTDSGVDADLTDLPDVTDDMGTDTDADDMAEMDMPSGLCTPNRDGVISRNEITFQTGLNAKFKVTTRGMFDTSGSEQNGEQVWDFSDDLTGDALTLVELVSPRDFWFFADFPDATYVTKLAADSDLLGIFQATEDALLLLGVASPEDGFTRTNFSYDPPVEVLKFPMNATSEWSTTSSVSGVALGVPVLYTERYTTLASGEGTAKTPFADFPVLRLRVELERTIGLVTTDVRQYVFVTECFGTVATVRSKDNEQGIEFSEPAEIRRLSP
jgi:hypothetical protein